MKTLTVDFRLFTGPSGDSDGGGRFWGALSFGSAAAWGNLVDATSFLILDGCYFLEK